MLIPKKEDVKTVSFNTPEEKLNVFRLCLELQSICEHNNGIGISAVQVGIPLQLFLVKSLGSKKIATFNNYGYFINCEYEPQPNAKRIVSLEGCLSLRSSDGCMRHFQVERWSAVTVKGYSLDPINNNIVEINFELGMDEQSIVFQHEIDHQNGLLISDIGKELFLWRVR
jgi:peptide deformylase